MTITDTLTRAATPSSMSAWIRGDSTAAPPIAQPAASAGEVRAARRPDWRRLWEDAALVVPLCLVNGFAMYGQAQWALERITEVVAVAWLFAVAVESIGLYLAAEAHRALMAGDAAARLRVASYAVAGLVGYLNWTHWASNVAAAAVFAGFSAVSPWLWSIRSRSRRRAALREAGLIDPRSVRFSSARWLLFPARTARAFRAAVWAGETDPAAAIGLVSGAAAGEPVKREQPTRVRVVPDPVLDRVGRPARPVAITTAVAAVPAASASGGSALRKTTDEVLLPLVRAAVAEGKAREAVIRAVAREGWALGSGRADRLIALVEREQI